MRGRLAGVALVVAALAIPVGVSWADPGHGSHQRRIKHVLLISVDGLHQSDLQWWVANNPGSELARLVDGGAEYANARTPVPSDSDPGMTAQMTGGNPKTTSVYYDDAYNHALFPPGTTKCKGTPSGSPVIYDSPDDKNPTRLDAGQGLKGLPGSISKMTSHPQKLLEPSTFPVSSKTCKPIYPNQYLKVNTIMNVVHNHHMLTAWSDKHPIYTSFDGPQGNGIDDSFDPEIDSNALLPNGKPYPRGGSWTDDNSATMQYDNYKVQAVLNWIDGLNHQGTEHAGVPALFGMNFQAVSTAEKLKTSDGLTGGYRPGTTTPGPLLVRALQYINDQVGRMVDEIKKQKLENSTAIIISAKHGQSPLNPDRLTRIDDTPIVNGANATCGQHGKPIVAFGTDDDAIMWWLTHTSQAAADCVKDYLWYHPASGVTYNGASRTLKHSGLRHIYAGQGAANFFGVSKSDPNHPDVWGVVQVGVVYTTGTKIAEHGGSNLEDRNVPILVYAPGVVAPGSHSKSVETTQIAPTILHLLGLDPKNLQAVRKEGTKILPGT
jgi:hypothetical protein